MWATSSADNEEQVRPRAPRKFVQNAAMVSRFLLGLPYVFSRSP